MKQLFENIENFTLIYLYVIYTLLTTYSKKWVTTPWSLRGHRIRPKF